MSSEINDLSDVKHSFSNNISLWIYRKTFSKNKFYATYKLSEIQSFT